MLDFLFSGLKIYTDPLAALGFDPAAVENLADPFAEETAETLLQRLDEQLHRPADSAAAGSKKHWVKGHGLDFAELREYQPGDEIRKIDWNVYARTLVPHIKEFHEEKQLVLWVFLDLTPSMDYLSGLGPERIISKLAWAIDALGLLGKLALYGQYAIGLYAMTPNGAVILKPKTGDAHLHRILTQAITAASDTRHCFVPMEAHAFQSHTESFSRLVAKQSTIMVLSDFWVAEPGLWEKPLGQLARQNQLFLMQVLDPIEAPQQSLPKLGLFPAVDLETRQTAWIDLEDPTAYQAQLQQRHADLQLRLSKIGKLLTVTTQMRPLEALTALIQMRGKYVAA